MVYILGGLKHTHTGAAIGDHVSGKLPLRGQGNNSSRICEMPLRGQGTSREKALSQESGQGCFNHTKYHLTEKVKGRFLPNLYHDNRLLLTHHFVYENFFLMI